MTDAAALYESILSSNIASIGDGDVLIDAHLGNEATDLRRGISLIIPISHMAKKFARLIDEFRLLEPEQYYYPPDDLHITIFDYIAANASYAPNQTLDERYVALTSEAIAAVRRFPVTFRGIVFSREAGLFTGYDDGTIIALRERIREILVQKGLSNTERYQSISVHATFTRFANRLSDPRAFANAIETWRDVEPGIEEVENMSLVEHDWYNRKKYTRSIKTFSLK